MKLTGSVDCVRRSLPLGSNRHPWMLTLLLISICPSESPAQAEWRPSRNVEIIVQVTAGGSSDRTARMIQRMLQDRQLVEATTAVVNKPGGGGAVAFNYLTQHAGDGHYWLVGSVTLLTSYASGQSKLHYTDITPLAILFSEYPAAAIRADSRIKDGRDLLDMLVKNPQEVVIAISPGLGTSNHIALAMAVKAAGGDVGKLKTVVFKSSPETVTALLGGHVEVLVSPASSLLSHVTSGKVRVVAVSSPGRLGGALAASPTWRELGIQAVFGNWRGALGAKGLTDAQVSYWGNVFGRLVSTPEWKDYLERNLLVELFLGGNESRKYLDAEYRQVAAIMKDLGLAK